jgi:hypothetical protein
MLASPPGHRDLGFVAVEGDAGDERLFHVGVFLKRDQRARTFDEGRQHAQRYLVLAGEFHRADLQHLGTEAGQFQHFLEGDLVEPARLGLDARIGGVNAVDVSVDLALVGLERRGKRDAGRVRAAAAERGDTTVGRDALEAGDHRDDAGLAVLDQTRAIDLLDARLHMRRVGLDRHLPAGIRAALHAEFAERQRQQADRHLLAGRGDLVELALTAACVDRARELEQAIGFARHRRDDDDDLMPLLLPGRHFARDMLDALDRAHRGATVFLNDKCH